MSPAPSFDASIPVLTEVFHDAPAGGAAAADPAATPISPTAPAIPAAEAAAQLETEAVNSWSVAEWSTLEHRLSERILHQLNRASTSCWNSASRTAWRKC